MSDSPCYLLDSNIFIYYFNDAKEVAEIFDRIDNGQALGYYSPVTWIELLSYPDLSQTEMVRIRDFLGLFEQVVLNESILDQTAALRRAHRIKLPDALIAACAIATQAQLVTRNVKDFMAIQGLQVMNPFSDQQIREQ